MRATLIRFALLLCALPLSVHAQLLAQIDTSRSSGVAPLAVYFDATSSTGLSGNDLLGAHIEWEFGDVGAGSWSTTGKPRNLATGFLAAHVFETPGQYTATVRVTDVAGNSASASVQIQVLDPESAYAGRTRCVSRTGDFTAAPAGCSTVSSTDLAAQLAWLNGAATRRLLFRRGESWTGNLHLSGAGPATLGAFGPGAPPVFHTQAGAQDGVDVSGTDWRVMDIEINGSQMGAAESAGGAGGSDVLALRIRAHHAPLVGWGMGGDDVFLVDSVIEDNSYFSVYTDGVGVAVMGSRIDQVRVATSFLRPLESRKVFIAHNVIDASRPAPTTGIKWHGRQGVITDNRIRAGTSRIGLSNSEGSPTGLDVDRDLGMLLIERNRLEPNGNPVVDDYNTWGVSFGFNTAVMVRNNLLVDMNIAFGGGEGHAADVRVLHNTVLMTDAVRGLNLANGDFIGFHQTLEDFVFAHNLVAILATVAGSAYPEPGLFIRLQDGNGITLSHNLVYKPDHAIDNFIASGPNAGYHTQAQWMTLGIDTGSIEAAPQFVSLDPNAANFLDLLATSPAVDSALPSGTQADYHGRPRPQDGDGQGAPAPDIGAIEREAFVPIGLLFANGFEG
ncbi:MAG: PKD domain-containing protein [Xanthomonadales bacterium]|nr:PKD domain-containing protein [Xanthomonadales bacterium]